METIRRGATVSPEYTVTGDMTSWDPYVTYSNNGWSLVKSGSAITSEYHEGDDGDYPDGCTVFRVELGQEDTLQFPEWHIIHVQLVLLKDGVRRESDEGLFLAGRTSVPYALPVVE